MRDRAGLLWRIVLGACLLAGLAILAFALAAALPPVHRLTMAASSRWPVQAPRLVVLATLALIVSLTPPIRRVRRWGRSAIATTAAAAAVSLAMTAHLAVVVANAGGSINPLHALAFTSMDAKPDDVVTYAEPGLSAVVYRPARDSAPVIVYVHGGGWTEGSATDIGHDLRWFADRGWLVVSVNYRLASPSHATWDEAHRDVACALVWVRTHAARWGGDAERLAFAGDSAGGTLALTVAYAAAQGRAQSGCGGSVPVPDAVVVQYPVADLRDAYANGYPAGLAEPTVFIERYLGGVPDGVPERLQAVSPDTYVSAAAPPTLIVEPDRDGLIPTAGVVRFAERARAAGVAVTLVRLPYANHAFDQMAAGSLGNQASLTIRQHYLVTHGLGPS